MNIPRILIESTIQNQTKLYQEKNYPIINNFHKNNIFISINFKTVILKLNQYQIHYKNLY